MADNKTRIQLVEAAKRALRQQGFKIERLPGRGLSNIWRLEKDGKVQKACIRTTQDRWYAFPPMAGGTKWKTLDDVDSVVVSTVDAKDSPKLAQVYLFPAAEVRKRFHAAYHARTIDEGRTVPDGYGMWVNLDTDNRGIAASVGSGIASEHQQMAAIPLTSLSEGEDSEAEGLDLADGDGAALATIADVIAFARDHIARLAGVGIDDVKLDLKITY